MGGDRVSGVKAWVRSGDVAQVGASGGEHEAGERLKTLERENRELRRANEILRKAAAFFAQAELDRRGT